METCTAGSITALAPWFGSKRNLAPEIVQELGEHSCYWEPFCGSMSILLRKPAVPMETVNDLHGDIVNLGRVVQDARLGPMLYRRARRVLGAKALSDEAAERFRERGNCPAGATPDLERAYDYLLSSWMGRNGVAGTHSYNQGFSRRFTVNGGHSGKRWRSVVDSIPQWRRRMAQVTILSEDGIGLIERIEDHRRLAKAVARFRRARVVVSYYAHAEVDRLYPGWTQRKIVVTKSLAALGSGRKSNAVQAVEVLLLNGPSYAQAKERSLFG